MEVRSWEHLEVHFQPVVSLTDARPFVVEALLRWRHPTHGLLPAASFIGEIQRIGALHGLCHFVLDRGLDALPALRAAWGTPDLRLAVNVWSDEAVGGHLLADLQHCLADHSVPTDDVVVEVTELAALDADVAAVLARVRMLGVAIAIDDFSTGEAGFAVLDQIDAEQVKIDRRLCAEVAEGQIARRLVEALVCLGRDLGLTIVAEGVESAGQARLLRELGVHGAQGYWFGPPAPLEQILAADGVRTS
jgi:EAL domain-containing protein (putative c-di-GMP-specific phosphodiesterase class I)